MVSFINNKSSTLSDSNILYVVIYLIVDKIELLQMLLMRFVT